MSQWAGQAHVGVGRHSVRPTLIATIYGMNFANLPGLGEPRGFALWWGSCQASASCCSKNPSCRVGSRVECSFSSPHRVLCHWLNSTRTSQRPSLVLSRASLPAPIQLTSFGLPQLVNTSIRSVSTLGLADLVIDAVYEGGRSGNAGDDPFPHLLGMSNQGGFRYRGDLRSGLELVVLISNMSDPDWPDHLDPETGILTYYGDNKEPGRALHDTGRRGNALLRQVFENAQMGAEGRGRVPPILVFNSLRHWRDAVFRGLAIPGASELTLPEDLVAIWRTKGGKRFQNYRARLTILETPVISRAWLDSIISGKPSAAAAPQAWLAWVRTGSRRPLIAARSLEYRTPAEQIPEHAVERELVQVVRRHFTNRPHDFEHFAADLARLMLPDIDTLDVTRPSRDGGRDAVGFLRIGHGPGSILIDFALEAKCYNPPNSVGVREVSRLISRIRPRQFGILVTTTWLDTQAYQEIKADGHPIVVISSIEIASLLKASGRGDPVQLSHWLAEAFPPPSAPQR